MKCGDPPLIFTIGTLGPFAFEERAWAVLQRIDQGSSADMKVNTTPLTELLILEPRVYGDERGFFFEGFREKEFAKQTGQSVRFVQGNHSRSQRGVQSGLQYQKSSTA